MNRLLFVDIAKGIAMLVVILGHTSHGMPAWFRGFAYSFHMPLYFILSGYFIKGRYYPEKQFLKKTFRSYILPYLLTVVGILLLSVFFNLLKGREILPDVLKWLCAGLYGSGGRTSWILWPKKLPVIGATWFLLALFFASNLLNAINRLRNDGIVAEVFCFVLV